MEVKTFYILPKIEKIKTEDITVKDTLRITVAEENILNLASNIKKNGLISPLYVRKDINCPKKYILVSGYRRLKALSFLGVKTVPAVVLSLTDAEAMLLPLCSEQLKEEICPFERAFYMAKSLKAGVTKNELANFLGISKTALENELLLLKITAEERKIIKNHNFNKDFIYMFLQFDETERQDILDKIIVKNMGNDDAIKYLKDLKNPKEKHIKTALISNDTLILNSIERIVKQLEFSGVKARFFKTENEEKKQYVIEIVK